MPGPGKPFQPGNAGGGRPADTPEVKEAKRLARSKSIVAIKFLIKVLEDEKQELKWRMQAAQSILDRGIGKPAQEQPENGDDRPITVADLDRLIEQLRNGSE